MDNIALNLVSSILRIATDEPNVENIHSMVDQLASGSRHATVSIAPVKKKGIIPECAYCLQKITRGTWHTVKKSRQESKNWAIIKHYHLECIDHLSPTKREQFLAIVGASDEVSDNVREDLKEQIDELNRNMDRRG